MTIGLKTAFHLKLTGSEQPKEVNNNSCEKWFYLDMGI
jgi:hypothetical protein